MSFAAYITSFLTKENPTLRKAKSACVKKQINWWLENTDIPIFVTSMNYENDDYVEPHPRLVYIDTPPLKTNPARMKAFERFYQSNYDFGIFMDDDAILYDKHHNSGSKLFSEMDKQIDAYNQVDVFFPINPMQMGFTPIWTKSNGMHDTNHVFVRDLYLKGSLFVVRNFPKFGKTPIYPDPSYHWQDDAKFATECVANGYTVMRCENIVLNELDSKASNFASNPSDRIEPMREANTRLAKEYEHLGLKMKQESHSLDRSDFYKNAWKFQFTKVIVPKPDVENTFTSLFTF
jgi:hypothetical protein